MRYVELNFIAYPMTMALYDGIKLIGQKTIDNPLQSFSEVIDGIDTISSFNKSTLKRAVHLFKAEKIKIEERE